MNKELGLLNLISILVGLLFIAFAVVAALFYPPLLSTDNLFIISVCLVMALLFMVNPLFYLHSEGRLPIPFAKRLGIAPRTSTPAPALTSTPAVQLANQARPSSPPLLDVKGRAVPPDVKSMMANMNPKAKDS
jgi:hypothetical protein